jgi:hypothetical protein
MYQAPLEHPGLLCSSLHMGRQTPMQLGTSMTMQLTHHPRLMEVKFRASHCAGLSVLADALITRAYQPRVPGSPKRASRSIVWVVDQAAATMGGKGSCSSAMSPIARLSSGVSGMAVKP